ncbi:MAG: hypothetical protein V7K24_22395 [Nostoc sp.]
MSRAIKLHQEDVWKLSSPGDYKSHASCSWGATAVDGFPGIKQVAWKPPRPHWLGYIGKTHRRGLKSLDFLLVHGGRRKFV